MSEHLSHLGRVRMPNQERWDHLREMALQRDLVSPDGDIYLWEAEISNDLLDSYFTHMSESTLRNYAQDASAGVAFLRGHDWHSLPLGYSLTGEYQVETDKKRVIASFYTVPGLADTDDLIARMKHGLVRDVSVGFHGGGATCDLCGEEFFECRHFPGLKYEDALATFSINDARLSEVSGVYDGSTPGAMVLKAQRAASRGELTQEQISILENRYRVALPATRTFFVPNIKGGLMNEEQVIKIRTMLGVNQDEEIIPGIESTLESMRALAVDIEKLRPLAAEGAQYRSDLVQEALAQGVRAQGNNFDAKLYKTTLENAPLEVVKRMRDDWKHIADVVLPAGRSSVDDETRAEHRSLSAVPDEAYA